MQRTVVILKPDCLQRGLVGEITRRFEHKGLKLVGLKMMQATDEILDVHYAHHKDKLFFASLKKFMRSSPIVCMLWEGVDAVEVVRKMAGATNGRMAEFGTIRGDYSISTSANLIHASDSGETAKKEEERFFDSGEIFDWKMVISGYLYGEDEK
ncbi:nucleoside-diphosphate kinase [Candidatus Curtissbacteria bacterium RIFCSPHIGHO2_01_FULL_41_44]|nr:MAG: nucleoside-diphosphate kinase [Candidatus Curtissbacteria bacterium RIFCSPHIGHO2_01_FULL_41_44]OGD97046.1 MAG: nucleoside-diphosphate kinase [Candidatus Curtissbacteria bacterium RIFCSPHIGHO2_12_FULL_42_33]OGE09924.1 MAG: nucleoside-diphosphate kinase [Candidatus Curtissbacteria bacterium RIFCSPLOWO2_02_FULL_42_37]